ncbi:MAG: protein-L-isoaspartate(D-aspartate) O-methyltransferase [Candidatus Aenigmarchaeota archaeon]|nr:protein-L-isoaspartate(D-aspartate) O-methyltransferase [Candidatus Aenigmarchaeota archaeon]
MVDKMLAEKKETLIKYLIRTGHLKTERIIRAFRNVPREVFVPTHMKDYAYVNEPLPIGEGQTISQPLTIADMTEALEPRPGQKILEIGAGSGYQAALLAEIVGDKGRIISVERVKKLAEEARQRIKKLGYKNILIVVGDGSVGYVKEAPYDRIIVTCAAPAVPEPLKEQLKTGGIMIIPVGSWLQEIFKIKKTNSGFEKQSLGFYQFVPLIGKYGFSP